MLFTEIMAFWQLILLAWGLCAAFMHAQWQFHAIVFPASCTLSARCQKHSHSVNVVGQITQTDFYSCSAYADRAQQQVPCFLGLHAKDLLNPRTDLGPCLVAVQFSWRQLAMTVPHALVIC